MKPSDTFTGGVDHGTGVGPTTLVGHHWTPVCRRDDLVPDRGVRALVEGRAVAVFRCTFGTGLYAIDDLDPFTGASVLSRGLVGTTTTSDGATVPYVSSPLRKQRISLATGLALDEESVAVSPWAVRVTDGLVEIGPRGPVEPRPSIIPGQ